MQKCYHTRARKASETPLLNLPQQFQTTPFLHTPGVTRPDGAVNPPIPTWEVAHLMSGSVRLVTPRLPIVYNWPDYFLTYTWADP